jgi:hypothetical protein
MVLSSSSSLISSPESSESSSKAAGAGTSIAGAAGDVARATRFPYDPCSMTVHPLSRCRSRPFKKINFFDELVRRSWLSGGNANLRASGAFARSLLGPEQEPKTQNSLKTKGDKEQE